MLSIQRLRFPIVIAAVILLTFSLCTIPQKVTSSKVHLNEQECSELFDGNFMSLNSTEKRCVSQILVGIRKMPTQGLVNALIGTEEVGENKLRALYMQCINDLIVEELERRYIDNSCDDREVIERYKDSGFCMYRGEAALDRYLKIQVQAWMNSYKN